MEKTILLTGATDGIGLETAKMLVAQGHRILLHGRNRAKLEAVKHTLSGLRHDARLETFVADLSRMADVAALAHSVAETHRQLDGLINNAGVFKVTETVTADGLDTRFAVNTVAPYLLTQRLLPLFGASGRVVNLSSAAQAPVDPLALAGDARVTDDFAAYAQSKLALTMWTRAVAGTLGDAGPVIVAVNPGSLLATKMVKDGFGMAGNDIGIGADILCRAALSEEFAGASGLYFDNDSGRFAAPHADARDPARCAHIVRVIEEIMARTGQ